MGGAVVALLKWWWNAHVRTCVTMQTRCSGSRASARTGMHRRRCGGRGEIRMDRRSGGTCPSDRVAGGTRQTLVRLAASNPRRATRVAFHLQEGRADASQLVPLGGLDARGLPTLHCHGDQQEQDEIQELQQRCPEHLPPCESVRLGFDVRGWRCRLDLGRAVRMVDGALGVFQRTTKIFRCFFVGKSRGVFSTWHDKELVQGHFASICLPSQLLQLPQLVECNHGVRMMAPTEDGTRIVGHFRHGLAHVLPTHGLLEGFVLVQLMHGSAQRSLGTKRFHVRHDVLLPGSSFVRAFRDRLFHDRSRRRGCGTVSNRGVVRLTFQCRVAFHACRSTLANPMHRTWTSQLFGECVCVVSLHLPFDGWS
mmetsp:Transcript_10878/g.67189  ORF Transcript_10878/g.67189 Transcript_10878/m.67189 type:complete len:366 (-) Transcript_10878:757-1854(-)